MGAFGHIDLVRIEDIFRLGRFDECRPVIGMGDFDEGLGPLAQGSAAQVGRAVFGGDDIHRFPEPEFIGKTLDREQNVGFVFEIPAREGEYGISATRDFRAV